MERFEVFSLGKHFLHVYTEKGFTLYANAKLVDGQITSYTDKMVRRGGSWVIDVWRFLNKKDFPINPIYTAVFGFDSEDTSVSVTGTDIDVDSISGVNGQLVDIGNISLPENQSLNVNLYGGVEVETKVLTSEEDFPDISGYVDFDFDGTYDFLIGANEHIYVNGQRKDLLYKTPNLVHKAFIYYWHSASDGGIVFVCYRETDSGTHFYEYEIPRSILNGSNFIRIMRGHNKILQIVY